MAKLTPAYLKKLEDLLEGSGYEVRYEKGNFKSGYCVLEAKKVVVINKFSTLESRIQSLVEIVTNLSQSGMITGDLRSAGLKNPLRSDSPELFDQPAENENVSATRLEESQESAIPLNN